MASPSRDASSSREVRTVNPYTRSRGRHGCGRPRGGADEVRGAAHARPRSAGRGRRLRRPLRRVRAAHVRAAAAGDQHRRRRHQGRDRAGDRQARHDRARPGRHGRRRHRRGRGEAAVHDRLHRVRQGLPRAHRRHRRGHRARLLRDRHRARRRRDGRAPRPPRRRTTTTSRAPRPASSRPTASSAPTACARATSSSRSPSSGLHSNGYSLVRHIVTRAGIQYGDTRPQTSAPRGARPCSSRRACTRHRCCGSSPSAGDGVHALSHVTGGGIAANLARVLPRDTWVEVDRSTWSPPPVFRVLADLGDLELEATEGTWNLGIGFLAVVAADTADAAASALAAGRHRGLAGRRRPRRRPAGRRPRRLRAGREGRRRRRRAPRRNLQRRDGAN